MTTYDEALVWLRQYAENQKAYGYPARIKDLRDYRRWKNMPFDTQYDEKLLDEVNNGTA